MRVILQNWGPIRKFEYDFSKNMIVTYGNNNIGKSYAMQVAYLMLKYLLKYSNRIARIYRIGYFYEEVKREEKAPEVQVVMNFSQNADLDVEDISKKMEEICAKRLAQDLFPMLTDAFENTFGTYEDMRDNGSQVILEIENRIHCAFDFKNEKILLDMQRKPTRLRKTVSEFHKSRNGKEQLDIYVYGNHISTPIELLEEEISKMQREFAVQILRNIKSVYFLPASRSGIYTGMSSFAPILAQLSQSRPYIRGSIQIPSIPEPISDYYMMLSEIRGDVQGHFPEYAEEIEKSVLKGEVSFDKKSKAILYRSFEDKVQLEMRDTSSMVSEISPITAFLKYIIERGISLQLKRLIGQNEQPKSIIFIEEPEAHLHPSNQIALIKAFSKLVKQNVILVLASHSNYIFNQLNNLILAKELDENCYSPILLSKNGKKSVSAFMHIDELGVDDENFADVSAQLLDEREEIIERIIEAQGENA